MVFLTGNAGEELAGKVLDLAVGERHKTIALEEVEHALAEKIHDDADVPSVIEAVPEMNTPVPVLGVVGSERLEDPELDLARFPVLLYRANDLDSDKSVVDLVPGLYDLAERPLPKQLDYLVYADTRQ